MSRHGLTRRSILQISGVGAAGAMAGCLGDDEGDEDGEIHILTDFNNEAWQAYWEDDLVPSWDEDNPDSPLNVEYAGFEGVGEQRLATLMQGGNPPEFYHATLSEMGDLVNQGLTMPVNDVVDDLEDTWGGEVLFKDTITPVGDEVHSIPHAVYFGGCLNYRADIYAALELEVPETWDELIENARIIDEAGGEYEDVRGFAVPAPSAGKSGSDFSNWLYNSGGWIWEWANNGGDEVELWFDEQHVLPVYDLFLELAEYSPDPSGFSWADTIEQWVAGNIGQCLMNNAWLCGVAYSVGQAEGGATQEALEGLALATEQAPVPHREGADLFQRGWVLVNGTPLFEGSSNPEGGKDFKRYMYGEERHIEVSLIEPMRFLPPYESIIEADEYRNADVFQFADGALYEKNQYVLNEIGPTLTSDVSPTTPETLYAGAFNIADEMINELVVEERDKQDVYERARDRFQERIEEAREVADY